MINAPESFFSDSPVCLQKLFQILSAQNRLSKFFTSYTSSQLSGRTVGAFPCLKHKNARLASTEGQAGKCAIHPVLFICRLNKGIEIPAVIQEIQAD